MCCFIHMQHHWWLVATWHTCKNRIVSSLWFANFADVLNRNLRYWAKLFTWTKFYFYFILFCFVQFRSDKTSLIVSRYFTHLSRHSQNNRWERYLLTICDVVLWTKLNETKQNEVKNKILSKLKLLFINFVHFALMKLNKMKCEPQLWQNKYFYQLFVIFYASSGWFWTFELRSIGQLFYQLCCLVNLPSF